MPSLAQLSSTYQRDGFVVVPDVLTREAVAAAARRMDELVDDAGALAKAEFERPAAGGSRQVRKLVDLAVDDQVFAPLARSDRILDVAAGLTGAQGIRLYGDQAFLKPAFTGSEKPLHQDNAYFRVNPSDAGVTCWIAIDDATIDNGCVNYVPGSQLRGLVGHHEIAGTPHLVPEHDDGAAARPCPVPAGSAIFHHLLVLHSSKGNCSPRPRRAWALHLVADHATCPGRAMADLPRLR